MEEFDEEYAEEYDNESEGPPPVMPFSMPRIASLAKDPAVLATVAVGAAAAALLGANSQGVRHALAGAMNGLSRQGLRLAAQVMPKDDPGMSLLSAALAGASQAKPHRKPTAPTHWLPAIGEALWTQPQKLQSLAPAAREKIEGLLSDLRHLGYTPEIVFAWRSLPTQEQLIKAKKSTRAFGMHNAMHEGVAASLAADIVDLQCGWAGPRATKFFKDLHAAAKKRGLYMRALEPWHVQSQPDTALPAVLEAYKLSQQ